MSNAPLVAGHPGAAHPGAALERPNFDPAMAWSAVLAGGAAAVGISLVMFVLGAGLGFSSVSPWANRGVSATTLGVWSVIWVVLTQWIAALVGGYFAGRLRDRSTDPAADEVFFRDTAHGFLAWCVGTLFTAAFLASALTAVVGTGAQAVATGAAQGATVAAAQPGSSDAGSYFVDSLFRSERPDPAASAGAGQAEAGRIMARGLATGDMPAADRTYLAQLVATRTGLAQPEAQRRVDEVISQAREAADSARRTAARTSIVLALSLFVGAFIASVAGGLGGRARDEL